MKSTSFKPFPALKFHAPTRQHYIWDSARKGRFHLGRDYAEAVKRYERMKTDYEERAKATVAPTPALPPLSAGLSVAEVLAAYVRHRKTEGVGQQDLNRLKNAARIAAEHFGMEPATAFRAKQLRALRDRMLVTLSKKCAKAKVKRPGQRNITPQTTVPVTLSRRYVNRLVSDIRSAWTWAASEDLIPAESAMVLKTLPGIRKGKGGREVMRVTDVEPWVVAATMPELDPTHAAMVTSQQLAGMRPGELCKLRRRDLSTNVDEQVPLPETNKKVSAFKVGKVLVWLAIPESHKTLWRGKKPRTIAIGPKAQTILAPFLDGLGPDDYLFSPRKASDARRAVLEQAAVYGRGRTPGRRYKTGSYGQAIGRAVERVNRKRAAESPPLPPIPQWRPNQLRHSMATEVASKYDRTFAAAALGNGPDVIDIYVEHEMRKAGTVAADMG